MYSKASVLLPVCHQAHFSEGKLLLTESVTFPFSVTCYGGKWKLSPRISCNGPWQSHSRVKGWTENGHSLLLSVPSMWVVWCPPVTRDSPLEFLSERVGRESEYARESWTRGGRKRQARDWAVSNKTLSPNLPLPLSSFSFSGFIRNLLQAGKALPSGATSILLCNSIAQSEIIKWNYLANYHP